MSSRDIVIGVLSDVTGRHPSDIKPENELFFDLEMDSVDLIDVIIRLEDHGIFIKEKDLTQKLTVSNLIKVVSTSGVTNN